jgi:hypothetical protein
MSRKGNAASSDVQNHDESGAHVWREMALAFFTKALSRAYAFRKCEEVKWPRSNRSRGNVKGSGMKFANSHSGAIESAAQRSRCWNLTQAGGRPVRPRGQGFADAGAVSATAPAQNSGERFSQFADGCGEKEGN